MDLAAPQCDSLIRLPVLHALSNAININVRELVNARAAGSLSMLAWLARNILELLLWTDYCLTSNDNALQFYGSEREFGGSAD